MKTVSIAYINFWKIDKNDDYYFTKFIEKNNIGKVEIVNYTDNPDILFCSCLDDYNYVELREIKNIKAKSKIFFYGENLNRFPPYNNDKLLYDTFDLIVGFKHTDLSKKQIRVPLWLLYYDYYNYDENDNILIDIQTKYNENIKLQKKLFATMIARHGAGGKREKIFNELANYGEVMSPGKFMNNTEPIGGTSKDKNDYIKYGLYNICLENSSYEGYFTEKIFQAFEGGTIPLYWASDLPEQDIINNNKYCFCDINNEHSFKKSINDAATEPTKYIEGDLFTPDASKYLKHFYDTLLERISLFV